VASALAVRLKIARLPDQLTWPRLTGTATIAGIGFTVSLFITGLALDQTELQNAARLAILTTSVAAALLGVTIVHRADQTHRPH
jgi:Na+:H+ antiporter, NhaA family